MLKEISIILVFLTAVLGLKAQDLIVTHNNDSLECQITKVSGNMIHITFMEDSVEQKAVMPRSMIKHYAVDYKNTWEDPKIIAVEPTYPKFRASFGGGLGNLIGAIPNNIPDNLVPYVEELKSGNHLAAAVCFYASENAGLGIVYSLFKTQNSLNNISVVDTAGNVTFGLLEDDISIHYIGPSLCLRQSLPRGSAHLVSNLSLGMLWYINDATVIDKYTINGSALAFSGDIGLDFELEGGFHFGIAFGLTLGVIREVTIESDKAIETLDLTTLEYSNASRFDLGIGLRYFM